MDQELSQSRLAADWRVLSILSALPWQFINDGYIAETLTASAMYHALIRTHHITSRKKVATLKAAAKKLNCYALLRSGGVPGLMYVESSDLKDTQSWVDTVHGLRYKDYQLIAAPSAGGKEIVPATGRGILEEVDNAREFAAAMESKGLLKWWRTAMGYVHE